jgi:hypothetical protein
MPAFPLPGRASGGDKGIEIRKEGEGMKLTSEDKKILKNWGYKSSDFKQIERATSKTEYELDDERMSLTEVLQVLDRKTYLSGIARSAFHWSACRENEKGQTVYFNSSKLFN